MTSPLPPSRDLALACAACGVHFAYRALLDHRGEPAGGLPRLCWYCACVAVRNATR